MMKNKATVFAAFVMFVGGAVIGRISADTSHATVAVQAKTPMAIMQAAGNLPVQSYDAI